MAGVKTIHIVGGPTASGKSSFAMDLAARENGVIINADSMQIYNRLPIITAQPDESDKAKIPHRLYGTMDVNDACSAGNWREMAEPVIKDILDAGQTPIVVGGTGLYIKSLTEGLSPIPDIPPETRDAVVQKYHDLGAGKFYSELERRDPAMAARLHVNHKARIIRAMEVLEATGKSLAEWQKLPPLAPPSDWHFSISLILPERETLYQRCNDRFVHMLDNGALEEVKAFDDDIASGAIKSDALLTKTLGVTPVRRYLHGEIDKETAITLAQTETRHYAKRQTTWFRHQVKSTDQIHVERVS